MILVTSRGCILINLLKILPSKVMLCPPSGWIVGMVWMMDSVMHCDCVVVNLEICCLLVLGSVGVLSPSHTREHGARSWSAMPSVSRNPAHTLVLQPKAIKRFVITEMAPTRAFSWLKAATTAFTFKNLLRHYAKRALTPRSLNVKLGPRRNYQLHSRGLLRD